MPGRDQLVEDALEDGAQILPDAVLSLSDTFCGCGDPESAWVWVLNYLTAKEAMEFREEDNRGSGLVAAYLLDHLVAYGCRQRSAFLPPRARTRLARR